ncbi:hypothetical protein FKM82_029633 [Ascaphus truei]
MEGSVNKTNHIHAHRGFGKMYLLSQSWTTTSICAKQPLVFQSHTMAALPHKSRIIKSINHSNGADFLRGYASRRVEVHNVFGHNI